MGNHITRKDLALIAERAHALLGFEFEHRGPGYAVIHRSTPHPREWWCQLKSAAVFIRRSYARPSADFGPRSLVLVQPKDEWERMAPAEERRFIRGRYDSVLELEASE